MADKPSPRHARIGREANAHILALHARFREVTVHALKQNADPIQLFCECGCMRLLDVTPTDYDQDGGAWVEGHKPSG